MTFGQVYDLMKEELRTEWEADFPSLENWDGTAHGVTIVPGKLLGELTDDEVLSWAGENGAEPVDPR
jgi:hypothetical protein